MPLPRVQEIGLDARVLGFTTADLDPHRDAVRAGAGAAWRRTRRSKRRSGKAVARAPKDARTRRVRSVLVVAEVALALMLLVGAGLLIRSVRGLLERRPRLRPRGALTMKVTVPASKYPEPAACSFSGTPAIALRGCPA